MITYDFLPLTYILVLLMEKYIGIVGEYSRLGVRWLSVLRRHSRKGQQDLIICFVVNVIHKNTGILITRRWSL